MVESDTVGVESRYEDFTVEVIKEREPEGMGSDKRCIVNLISI